MVSVSGVRGIVGKDLTPDLVMRYAAAFGALAIERGKGSVVLARDARTSGPMFESAARAALQGRAGDPVSREVPQGRRAQAQGGREGYPSPLQVDPRRRRGGRGLLLSGLTFAPVVCAF